jgi:hypothetical protein
MDNFKIPEYLVQIRTEKLPNAREKAMTMTDSAEDYLLHLGYKSCWELGAGHVIFPKFSCCQI